MSISYNITQHHIKSYHITPIIFLQLHMAIEAVFRSWFTPRAVAYRDIHNISNNLGTAVTIQAMVYGNVNQRSGSGVVFTRNPTTGEKVPYGEFLTMAEGEDVVSGNRTPMGLTDLQRSQPAVHDQLMNILTLLEKHYKDVQDVEFTGKEVSHVLHEIVYLSIYCIY